MAKKTKKPRKPQGRCIFCDGTGLSKEHIWSDWLGIVIPTNEAHGEIWGGVHFEKAVDGVRDFEITEPFHAETRQGCVLQRKIRNVCEKHCNNGWMSRVVEDAKPYVEKMIKGEAVELDRDAMTKLAAWIAVSTVMMEFANRRVQQIPKMDRAYLMEAKAPPESWTIWIAKYNGEEWNPMGHHHLPMTYSKGPTQGDPSPGDPPRHRLQMMTFALGELLVHVFTSDHAEMIDNYRRYIGESPKLLRLWPLPGNRLTWPQASAFSDVERKRLMFDWYHKRWAPVVRPTRLPPSEE